MALIVFCIFAIVNEQQIMGKFINPFTNVGFKII